jgi:hypothetical protein
MYSNWFNRKQNDGVHSNYQVSYILFENPWIAFKIIEIIKNGRAKSPVKWKLILKGGLIYNESLRYSK